MDAGGSILVAMLLSSLIPGVMIFFLPETSISFRTSLNLFGAVAKLLLIGVMMWGVFHRVRYLVIFPMLPEVDLVLRADALAMLFVSLSAVLWLCTTVYAISYLEVSPHRSRFFGFFSLCVTATMGIALAGNLFTFIVFYELLTLTTYPLVVHSGSEKALRAGRMYLAYTVTGGALLLLGAVLLHAEIGATPFDGGATMAVQAAPSHGVLRWAFMLLVAGVGVKAALVPLHSWLPQAMVAPAPVSALLHAVAVVKAGAFGVVRILYDVYGIQFSEALGLTTPLAIVASITIVYGSLQALRQQDLKRRLAFSTVSQVSYIALGVAVVGPSATVGGMVHLVHQGLMKITLFFCAGNLAETLEVSEIGQMRGVGRRMPATMLAFSVAAVGMIGTPPVAGFISKWYLGLGALEARQPWILVVLALSSLLNAAYFLPVLYRAWFQEPDREWQPRQGYFETRWGLLFPPLVTALLALLAGLLADGPFSPLRWARLIAERAYS
jgi:multicomponent Na+:H+ antiporter subunit D